MERHLSTSTAGTRKKRGEGHTRRDEILLAAKKLFLREGYEATTIRRIADVVGVSAPALYLYFKDKEAIMLALCDETFGNLVENMSKLEKTKLPPLERLRRCGEAYVRFGLDNPQEYWLTFLSGNTPKKVKEAKELSRTPESIDPNEPGAASAMAFAKLMGMFRDIEKAGMPLYFPVDTAAELVWMGLHGLVAALINNPEFPWTKRDILIAGMIDMAVRGVVRLP
ncbi:transcriptional regulator, TetR family [Enhydrobacter aerosaccus]|uniref:Transcriptional regulator, TetR family n=1 Tax=Enhydrobacter aerosaccus TaxID=225324 RepID=A0A1T4KV69_9HYPH|nr:transcriptional regulator, TetR family [Enhydrobacter aerosaccus]